MLEDAAIEVCGDAGIECLVGTLEDVEVVHRGRLEKSERSERSEESKKPNRLRKYLKNQSIKPFKHFRPFKPFRPSSKIDKSPPWRMYPSYSIREDPLRSDLFLSVKFRH